MRVGRGFDSPPLGPVSLGKSFSYFGTLTPSPIFPKIIAASPIFQKYATILGFLTNKTLGTFDLRLFTTCNCFCLESLWGEQICQVIWWWVRVWRCPRLKPHGCSLLGSAWEPDMSCTICAVFNCPVPVGSMTWEFLSTPPLCSPVSLIFCIWFHRNRTPDSPTLQIFTACL